LVGSLTLGYVAEARNVRIDSKTLKAADRLAKDREAHFAKEEAMATADFEKQWSEFAARLNDQYAGREVKLKRFGNDVGVRKGFTHLLYMAFKVGSHGTLLSPTPQELVAKHSFLQELVLEGSCYTGGDPFPKKLRDLLKADSAMQFQLREYLTDWTGEYRAVFEKEFPQVQ